MTVGHLNNDDTNVTAVPKATKSARHLNRLLVKSYLTRVTKFIECNKCYPSSSELALYIEDAKVDSHHDDPRGKYGRHRTDPVTEAIMNKALINLRKNYTKLVQKYGEDVDINSLKGKAKHTFECGTMLSSIDISRQTIMTTGRKTPRSSDNDTMSDIVSSSEEEIVVLDNMNGDEAAAINNLTVLERPSIDERSQETDDDRDDHDDTDDDAEGVTTSPQNNDSSIDASSRGFKGRGQRLNQALVYQLFRLRRDFFRANNRRPRHAENHQLMYDAWIKAKEVDPNGDLGYHRNIPPEATSISSLRRQLLKAHVKLVSQRATGKKSMDDGALSERDLHVLKCGKLIDELSEMESRTKRHADSSLDNQCSVTPACLNSEGKPVTKAKTTPVSLSAVVDSKSLPIPQSSDESPSSVLGLMQHSLRSEEDRWQQTMSFFSQTVELQRQMISSQEARDVQLQAHNTALLAVLQSLSKK